MPILSKSPVKMSDVVSGSHGVETMGYNRGVTHAPVNKAHGRPRNHV